MLPDARARIHINYDTRTGTGDAITTLLISMPESMNTSMSSREGDVRIAGLASTSCLNLPKLSEITYILKPVEDKYFDLGVQLDVGNDRIKQIEKEYQGTSRRFAETVTYWQNNSANPTWSILADALERVGGYDNLVRKLRACSADTHSSVDDTPGFTSASSGSIEPQCTSSEEYDTGFSSISLSSSLSEDSSHGPEIEYFEEIPGCGCPPDHEPCSMHTLSTSGCPTPSGTSGLVRKRVHSQSIRDGLLPNETEEEEEDYAEEYEKGTRRIRTQFAGLVTDTCNSFEKRNVKVPMLKLFLQNDLPASKPRINEVNEATPLEKVFMIVTDQACSWLDYEPIKNLTEKFGADNDKARLSKYEENLRKFVKQRLPKEMKHIKVGNGARRGSKQLLVKYDKEWSKMNFNDINKIRGNLATILNVRRRELYLASIREGCIMMTFMISQELAEHLFPRGSDCVMATSQIQSLKDEGIISLKCGKFSWRSIPTGNSDSADEEHEVYS